MPVPNATITIPASYKHTTSDSAGFFVLKNLNAGKYLISVIHIGYQQLDTLIALKKNPAVIDFILTEKNKILNTVVITGGHDSPNAKNQPVKATVISTREVAEQPASIVELMNRAPGIRVRQSGGMGAYTNLTINGFEGKAVKFFKDGIPIDYLGQAFNFSVVPVNMLERVEVYKGVLPAGLGADALGGAVNLVTRKENSSGINVSYQYGSYNTHAASLHAQYVNKQHTFFAGTDAFYTHSDNNYKVNVPLVDTATAVAHNAKLPLFHNRYTNNYAEAYAGLKNLKWADELRLGITGFDITRQYNYGATMITPLGGATGRMYSIVPTLRYRKELMNGHLRFDQFLVANKLHSLSTDTAGGIYSWAGEFTAVPSRVGEISANGSLSKIAYSNFTSRSNIAYDLNQKQLLTFNMVYATTGRLGSDPYGKKFLQSGQDVLSLPARFNKLVIAIGMESALIPSKLTNNLIAKYYQVKTSGNDGSYASLDESFQSNSSRRFGLAEALKYNAGANNYLRLSAELATRLPEQAEFFGDGNFVVPNFALLPEKSLNANFEFHLQNSPGATLTVNTFYRRTTNLILEVNTGLFAQNQNVQNVKGLGNEIDTSVPIVKWLAVNGNLTYQDMRLFGQQDPSYERARLRNTPYFFGNLGLQASFKRLLSAKDPFKIYWYYNFVREYYLNYIPRTSEPKGFLGLWGKPGINTESITIPDQHLHTVGFSWWPSSINKCAVGFEIKNLFDTPVYDNFRVQNAGRSIQAKVSYQFN